MSRTARLKAAYVIVLAVLLAGAYVAYRWIAKTVDPTAGILIAVALLVPGRVQGYFFRPFFIGRRLLAEGDAAAALEQFNLFLDQIRARPTRKKLVWLAWTIYSTDIEAMTHNNIGAAKVALSDYAAARDAFSHALALDPLYPIPHVNFARLALVEGKRGEAEAHLARAAQLGYRATSVDALVAEMQAILARVEGR